MLKRKIELIWLLLLMLVTSFLVTSGFVFYNWDRHNQLEQVSIPVKGMLGEAPGFDLNIEGEKTEEFLNKPLAVVFGNNKIYVTDSRNNRINVYNKKGKYLFSFGEKGVKEGEFNYPNTLAIDSKGNLYVGEFQNKRIQVFSSQGKFIRAIFSDEEKTISPLSITITADKVYVVNRNSTISVLSLNGELIRTFGKLGIEEGSLNFPNGIVVSKDGRIFISDSGNGRIQIFDKKGNFLQAFYGSNESRLNLPRGLAIDDLGRLYIVDTFSHNVSVYDDNLNFLFTIGERGIEEGHFNFPNEIFVDDEFRVYVTDRENNRVSVFAY